MYALHDGEQLTYPNHISGTSSWSDIPAFQHSIRNDGFPEDISVSPEVSISPTTGDEDTTFEGTASGFTPNASVTQTVYEPDGSPYPASRYTQERTTDGSGKFTWLWYWESGDPFGEYEAHFRDEASGEETTVSFTIETDEDEDKGDPLEVGEDGCQIRAQGHDTVYVLDVETADRPARSFHSPPAQADVRVANRTVTIAPSNDGFSVNISHEGNVVGSAPLPAVNETTTVGDVTIATERENETTILVVETDETRVPVAEKETY
jgi:hypothetical protein